MDSIFINKESLAFVPKLVGPVMKPMGSSDIYRDLLTVFIPTEPNKPGEVFIGKNGVKDLYRTVHSNGTVSVQPYLDDHEVYGEPVKEGTAAIKLVFQTEKPIYFNSKLPVPTEVIPKDFLTTHEFENEVRSFLTVVQDELPVIDGNPTNFVVTFSDLENSPKVLSVENVPDLKAEFQKTYREDFLNSLDWTAPRLQNVDGVLKNFMDSPHEDRIVDRPLVPRELINLILLGSTPSERFIQVLLQAIIFKLRNDQADHYFSDVSLVLPMTEDIGSEELEPLIVIQEEGQVFVLNISEGQKDIMSFSNLKSFTDFLRDEAGYTHFLKSDLNEKMIEGCLSYLYTTRMEATPDTVEALLDIISSNTGETPEGVQEDVALSEAVSAADKAKRPKIEKLMKSVFNTLDKTGLNTKRYQDELFSLDDAAFFRYIKKLTSNPRYNLELQVLPGKNEPNLEEINAALDILGVPEKEYVYMRHEGNKNNPLRTRYKQTVGYIHIRRLQQLLSKKNTYSLSIKQRNQKNNQVTGHDAIARISDLEVNALKAINADSILRELMGPRADSSDMKTDLYTQISTYGYSELNIMEGSLRNKRTLNTVSQYLIGAGLDNDLLVDDKRLINQIADL